MKDYLKKHATQAAYETWAASENYVTPNVSLIDANGGLTYNPYVEPMNIITYTASAKLRETTDQTGQYPGLHTNAFNTTIKSHTFENGVGTIEFYADVTNIGNIAFLGCNGLISIVIPNSVTSIEDNAFNECNGLISIVIPNSVTSIGDSAFKKCGSMTSITCNATTAPTIQNSTFQNVHTSGTLTVPSGATGYDVWMQNANYYLGLYGWTKVEQ